MKKLVWILLFVSALLIAGVVASAIQHNASDQLSEQQIKRYALQYVKGEVVFVHLQKNEYDVEVKGKDEVVYKLLLDAKSGELLSKEVKSAGDDENMSMTLSEAKEIALKKITGLIESAELNRSEKQYTIAMIRGIYEYILKVSIEKEKVIALKKKRIDYGENEISKKEVRLLALRAQSGKIVSLVQNEEDGVYFVKIIGDGRYEVQVDPYAKVVLHVEKINNKKKSSIKKEQASTMALQTVPGKITRSTLKNGVYHFTINTIKGTKYVNIDAETGKVVNGESDENHLNEGENSNAESNTNGIINSDTAVNYALAKQSGEVKSVTLNTQENKYDVVILHEGAIINMVVNATTGTVTFLNQQATEENPTSNDKDMTIDNNGDSKGATQNPHATQKQLLSEQTVSSIALSKASGTVTRIGLVNHTYDVEVRDGTYVYTVKIDGYSGAIVYFNKDYEQ